MHMSDSTDRRPATPSSVLPPAFQRGSGAPAQAPASPIRFAASSGAFGLSSSSAHQAQPSSNISVSPLSTTHLLPQALSPSPTATSPPSAGTVQTRRLRRPSLLSLASAAAADRVATDPTTSPTNALTAVSERDGSEGALQPNPRWGSGSAFPSLTTPERVSSAPPIPFEGLTTSASPAPDQGMDTDAPPRWLPSHLQPRRSSGSAIADPDDMPATPSRPFNARLQGRPLPGPLLATLISESSPLEHEMRSEARLQRLLMSHPSSLSLTPRQRRTMRMSRGRFPDMVGDDDDEDDNPRGLGSRWRAGSSDSDSDDMMEDDWPTSTPVQGAGAVNSAFASVMDLDRPSSGGSSALHSNNSGKSTPGGPRNGNATAGKSRVAPSPGTGLLLPTAFGGLGMGSAGSATPVGSPTAEKGDFVGSPSTNSVASPGMMQYRDPPTSIRAGKRKGKHPRAGRRSMAHVAAVAEERFDPYKRPRGSSPSPFQSVALSPSKPAAIPIPSSPSHIPALPSSLALSSPGYLSLGPSRPKPAHPYTRPMSSRSRAASPALGIGSTSGVLSSSLGNNGLTKEGKPMAGPFIPSGPGAKEAVHAAVDAGAAPNSLGSLGLLSLRAHLMAEEDDSERMEED